MKVAELADDRACQRGSRPGSHGAGGRQRGGWEGVAEAVATAALDFGWPAGITLNNPVPVSPGCAGGWMCRSPPTKASRRPRIRWCPRRPNIADRSPRWAYFGAAYRGAQITGLQRSHSPSESPPAYTAAACGARPRVQAGHRRAVEGWPSPQRSPTAFSQRPNADRRGAARLECSGDSGVDNRVLLTALLFRVINLAYDDNRTASDRWKSLSPARLSDSTSVLFLAAIIGAFDNRGVGATKTPAMMPDTAALIETRRAFRAMGHCSAELAVAPELVSSAVLDVLAAAWTAPRQFFAKPRPNSMTRVSSCRNARNKALENFSRKTAMTWPLATGSRFHVADRPVQLDCAHRPTSCPPTCIAAGAGDWFFWSRVADALPNGRYLQSSRILVLDGRKPS